jgi:hypothetical protein
MRKLLLILISLGVLSALIFAAWIALALTWTYSDGERAGYVQKFSRKGWLCKTWEGELAMVNLPGTAPEIWRFTVRDEAVAAAIQRDMGQRSVVHYAEHRGLLTRCFGDTNYFVDQVRLAGGAQ